MSPPSICPWWPIGLMTVPTSCAVVKRRTVTWPVCVCDRDLGHLSGEGRDRAVRFRVVEMRGLQGSALPRRGSSDLGE
jgi:hypothetical protein